MATTSAQVQQLYVAYLGRAADKAGLDYWLKELNADKATLTLENLRANFVNEQAEYKSEYAGLNRAETVTKVYNNLFGRAPDAAGQTYWTTGAGASVSVDQLQAAFVAGASTADAKIIANKVLVSEVYTSTAGANANAADAKAILAGVTGDVSTIATAVAKLEDGSLSGIAIPAGVGLLKADAAAAKAVIDFQDSKIADLVTANKALVALDAKQDAGHKAVLTAVADDTKDYNEAQNAIDNATAVRKAISADDTVVLDAKVLSADSALNTARTIFTTEEVGGVTTAKAYEAALVANAALTAPKPTDVKQAVDAFQATVANASNKAALDAANASAGTSFSTAQQVHDGLLKALTGTPAVAADLGATPPVVGSPAVAADPALAAKITSAFGSLEGFAKLSTTISAEAAKTNAVNAEATAKADLGTSTEATNYIKAVSDSAAAKATAADAKAADALVAQTKAIDDAWTALDKASNDAKVPAYALDLHTTKVGVDDKADLFYFAGGAKSTDDFSVTKFVKGDALYFGEGYTFNNGALSTGDNNKLEYFFVQKGADVQVVFETKAFGSANLVTNADTGAVTNGVGEDAAAVITLTGVTVAELQNNAGYIVHA